MEQTGAVWLAAQLTDSPLMLGLLGIVRAVPAFVLSPVAGVIADRFDQRKILMTTQSLSLVASAALGILVATGRIEVWQLYVQVAIQSALNAVDGSTRQAMFPTLVPRDHLIEAVTLQSSAARGSGMIGPAIGGFVIAALGESGPFLLNAVTDVGLIVALAAMRGMESRPAAASRSFRRELSEGFQYMLGSRVLRGLLGMELVFGLFGLNPVIITLIARGTLMVGPEGLGGLLAADGLGSLIGIAFLLTAGARHRQGRYVILGAIAYAGSLLVFAASQNYAMAFAALVVAGFWDAIMTVTRNSIMQLGAPAQLRGRVMANFGMVSRGVGPLAQLQSGLVSAATSAPWAVVVAALALGLNAANMARTNRQLWTISNTDVLGSGESSDSPGA